MITEAVTQFKTAIASIPTVRSQSGAMDTDDAADQKAPSNDMNPTQCHPYTSKMATSTLSHMETEVKTPTVTTTDLLDLIVGLNHDIATKLDISDLIVDLKLDIALIKSHPLFCNLQPINQHIPAT